MTPQAPDGPYSVIRWGRNWSVENILDRHAKQPRYDSQHQAQTEADKRNSARNYPATVEARSSAVRRG